jgi:hypothetical protein
VEFLDIAEALGFDPAKAIATPENILIYLLRVPAQLIVYSRHGIAWIGTEDMNRAISDRP